MTSIGIRDYEETSEPVSTILRRYQIGNSAFYEQLILLGIQKRASWGGKSSGRPRGENLAPYDRSHERRDCAHYYGDGGCLDKAAQKDLKTVPCNRCRKWVWGDNSEHHGEWGVK